MRTVRLVGLSPDGRHLLVATEPDHQGRVEELALPTDDRLRAALRGDRPRLGQLEIEMESALSPRDIQARIRSGQALEDVARTAGMPVERVERFARPVLAERSHVASLAMASSVRRRGETSGHRTLRVVLTERLHERGVNLDTLQPDAWRGEEGRWAVTARYRSGEADREALFWFDLNGRYCVAGNDDARWVLGEQSASRGPQPGRRRGEPATSADDAEPTLDLSDQLALVRAVQDEPEAVSVPVRGSEGEPFHAESTGQGSDTEQSDTEQSDTEQSDTEQSDTEESDTEEGHGPADDQPAAEEPGGSGSESGLETLYAMLEAQNPPKPELSYAAVTDAAAVPPPPVVGGAWEPPIVMRYPVEPSQVDDAAGTDEPAPPDAVVDRDDRLEETEAFRSEHALVSGGTPHDLTAVPDAHAPAVQPPDEPEPPAAEPAGPTPDPEAPAKPRAPRRKRAAVPSWDEIMFGGPRP